MWKEPLGDLNFIPHYFFLFVRVFLPAVIATYLDLLRQHGESAKCIGLPEEDFVLVPDIAFVMKSVILADHKPEIVGCVFHWVLPSKFPTTWRANFCTHYGRCRTGGCKKIVRRLLGSTL